MQARRWREVRDVWWARVSKVNRRVLWGALSLIVLWLIFEIPALFHTGTPRFRALRASGDLLALLTLYVVARALGWARPVKIAALLFGVLLFVFTLDRSLFSMIMREEPLLYDQVFMLKHLWVLLSDLWNLRTAMVVVAAIFGLAIIAFGTRWLLRAAHVFLEPERAQLTERVLFLCWIVALVASASDILGVSNKPLVRWTTPDLLDNARKSVAIARAVNRGFRTSPYLGYAKQHLTRKPDVHIYVVESYGRMIWERRSLYKQHQEFLRALERRLTDAGLSSVSAFSTSSVRGARSWLADGTLITGIGVPYEAILRHVLDEIEKHPTMVSFFHAQGYKTFLVSPADRPRTGVVQKDYYGYDRYVDFAAVNYRGQHYNWGLVPDQYTIGFMHDEVLSKVREPQFMNFHLVASHAPWASQPPIVEDWRSLNDGPLGPSVAVQPGTPKMDVVKTLRRLRTFDHTGADILFRANSKATMSAYVNTIEQDLELLVEEMTKPTERERIFILIGDHQPPLIASLEQSYDTPVHVIANHPELLREFRERGFRPGLRIGRDRDPAVTHAGMFSLLVRALAVCCGDPARAPRFLRTGQELEVKLERPTAERKSRL
jgi:hypothetical protein